MIGVDLSSDAVLDLRLEVAAGDVDRAGQRALVVLVGLADVEDGQRAPSALRRSVGGRGVDLGDLGLGRRRAESRNVGHARNATSLVGYCVAPDGTHRRRARQRRPTRAGRISPIWPTEHDVGERVHPVGSALTMIDRGPARLGQRHHVGHRVDLQRRADREQQIALLGGIAAPRRSPPARGSGRSRSCRS